MLGMGKHVPCYMQCDCGLSRDQSYVYWRAIASLSLKSDPITYIPNAMFRLLL